jgi:type II secretory pathway component GspD/PulD (secretin)
MSGHTAVGKQWTALFTIGGWRRRFLTAVSGGRYSTLFIFLIGFLVLGVVCASAQPGGKPPGPPGGPPGSPPPGGPPAGAPSGATPPSAPSGASSEAASSGSGESEPKGLSTPIIDVSFPDQKLTEVAELLSTLGSVNINVAGNVDQKILVNYSVKTEKSIRQVLDDLASLYKLWIDTAPDGSITIRPDTDKPLKAEDIKEKTFPVRFSRPSEILDLVRTFLSNSPQADAIALDSQKVIVVRDIPEGLARVEEFLNRVDIPKQSTVFPIMYGDPQEIADIIKERLPDLEEGALTVDTANSQLIVKTTLENLAEIQLLIETLDVKKEIRVFTISFHEVEDIVDMLEELNLLSEEGTVVSNEYTGRLIIQDTPERLDRIAEAIKAFDTPRPAVFVEAEIMDVNAAYTLGWSPTIQVGDAVPNSTSLTSDTGEAILDGQSLMKLAGSGAFDFAALDAGNLLAQLQANETESDSKTIASPRLIVERGEEARLTVGSEEPIGVRSYSNSYYNQSDIVTQRVREVGVRLIVEAMNISERGYTELYIGLENSSVPPDGRIDIGGGTTGLRVLTQNIETTAVLKDGRTLALGGLLTRDFSKSSEGAPFLNRVPLIRYLFSNLAKADTKRKLLLFVTPHILNLDSPYQKFMQDEDAFAKLEGKREATLGKDAGLAGIEDSSTAAMEDSGVTGETAGTPEAGEEHWVNVKGKWGFYDKDGQFVDRTSEFMNAFAAEGTGEGKEKISLTPKQSVAPASSASNALRQLTKPTSAPEAASQPETPVIKEEPKAPQAEPIEPEKEPAASTPPSTTTPDSQPKVSPKVGEVLSGNAAISAMKGSSNSIGKFKGSLRDLIRKVGNDSGVKRFGINKSIDQKTFDTGIEIDGTGKTYDQVMNEALGKSGMKVRYRPSDPPQILKIESKESAAPAPTTGAPVTPPSAPAPTAPPAPTTAPVETPAAQPQTKALGNDDPWTESPGSMGWSPEEGSQPGQSHEWTTLSGSQASAMRGPMDPIPTPQRESWEVSYESDQTAVPGEYHSLSAPAGFERRNQPPSMTEDAWGQLMDGKAPTGFTQASPSSDGLVAPARHTAARPGSHRTVPGLTAQPTTAAEPASLLVSQTKPEVAEKKGAWSKIKKLFTPGRQE